MSALALTATYTAIAPNLTSSFQGTGGTGPYTYSLQAGSLGSINASTGIYTAPNTYCVDTVIVTDNVSAEATLDIIVGSAIELVCDIIQTYMGLSQGQVIIYNTKFILPTDSRIYIAVMLASCKSFGNSNTNYNGVSSQAVNMRASLDINIMSRSIDALNQKEQILLAFGSQYAENQMEKNSFFIAPLSTNFVNVSMIDGAAIPYRFVISCQLQYFVASQMNTAYYDQFPKTQILVND